MFGSAEIGIYSGKLAKGCLYCRIGGKMVIFITGECHDNCYYCPVSEERFGKRVIYANERSINSIEEVIEEAIEMRAIGASLTGGDPLVSLEDSMKVVKILKEAFGNSFHIHLYTSGRYATPSSLISLERAGLDEIRFHPTKMKFLKAIELALKLTSMRVGIEIPSLPNEREWVEEIVKKAIEIGVDFININELEMNERNFTSLYSRGLRKKKDYLASVEGSKELALEMIRKYGKMINIHYCSARYKDLGETRTRFIRTSYWRALPFEEITPEGTIRKLLVKNNKEIRKLIDEGWGVMKGDYAEIYPGIKMEGKIIEEHPDFRKLRVEEINP